MNYTSTYTRDLSAAQKSCPNLNKLYNTKILITGANGLVCSAIVDFIINLNDTQNSNIIVYAAARSHEKYVQRFSEFLHRNDLIFLSYDALKPFECSQFFDYIIHGASPANPMLYATQPVETMLANLLSTNYLLKYATEHKSRLLFISSSEVYGQKDSSEPYGDSEYGYVDILNPRACYPSAKRACETLCAAYLSEHKTDSVIVRLGHVYGPTASRTDTRASSQFFFDVLEGHDIIMKSSGSQIRSYCYVIDCVSAIITVLLNGTQGSAYNISNPYSIASIREIADQIALCSGKKVVFENPSDIEKKGYNMMDNSSLDSSPLVSMGWHAQFDLKTGVSHTLKILSES